MTMKTLVPMATRVAAFGVLLMAFGERPAAAQHSVLLSVTPSSEEALTWCGVAAGQMAMSGYPTGPCVQTQDDIWQAILANKQDNLWDTDPIGLKGALTSLCGGTWIAPPYADSQTLMYWVAYFMTHYPYPVAMVLNTLPHNSYTAHQEHWVTIIGVVTDKDPTTNNPVTLQNVLFVDPSPANLSDPPIVHYVNGSTWYNYSGLQAVTKTGSPYQGKFVAVIEPPVVSGRAVAPVQAVTGHIIPPQEALQAAARWIRQLELTKISHFRNLAESKPLEPLLVNPERAGYYLIPYSQDGRTARFAVMVNAYTGEFQEVTAFAAKRYLPEKEAVDAAVRGLSIEAPKSVKAVAIFSPGAGLGTRYAPVWRVEVDGKTVLLDESGRIRKPARPLNQ
jgi:hypothetical protein